jgi:hypothetical protein
MSKPSETDERFQHYADMFNSPETHESIERGYRPLHWEFMETGWHTTTARNVISDHAREAVNEAARRTFAADRSLGHGIPVDGAVRTEQRRIQDAMEAARTERERPRRRRGRSR